MMMIETSTRVLSTVIIMIIMIIVLIIMYH